MSGSDELEDYNPTYQERQIAWKFGSQITQIQPQQVLKQGSKVASLEMKDMHLVREHLPDVPLPQIYDTRFEVDKKGICSYGEFVINYVPDKSLKDVWADLEDDVKLRLCHDIWKLVERIRTLLRPDDLRAGLYRTADGSPYLDPFLGDYNDRAPAILNDDTLRQRIYARYVDSNGLSYRDSADIPERLPRSGVSVFTHGDIGPRNIMVDGNLKVTALLDWEYAGWLPDY